MSRVDIREFRAEDLAGFVPGRPEMEVVKHITQGAQAYGAYLASQGPAWSGFDSEGTFLGAGGIGYYWPGVAEGWLLLSKGTDNYPFSLHRIVRLMVEKAFAVNGLKRLQVSVPVDMQRSRKWIARLGFVREGLMRRYGPDGHDYVLYAMVRE